ncbi:ComEC/Rec2 family competence protein [Bacillota bacterium Meth-B3]
MQFTAPNGPDAPVERFMRKRPLALAAALLAVGTAVGALGVVPCALFGAAAALLGGWVPFARRPVAAFALFLFVGAWGAGALATLPGPEPGDGVLVRGRVCAAPRVEDDRVTLTLDRVAIDGRPADTRLWLYRYAPTEVKVGDTVTATVETWRPQGQRNPGGFDFAAFLRRQGVRLCATVKGEAFRVESGRALSPMPLLERLRAAAGAALDRLFSDHAALARSMLLGDKGALPEELLEQFRTAGVAHLLAVSGLHVSALAVALAWLLRRFGLGRRRAFFITLPLIALYALLVGLPASAVRAALTFALAGGARLSGRPYDALTGLGAALSILLAAQPLSIGDPGLILSFSAIAGILLLAPTLRTLLRSSGRSRPVRHLLDALAVSLGAQLATLPALCCLYGAITPYALLTNLIAVPLGMLALPLIALALPFAALPAAAAVALPARLCLDALTLLTGRMSALPGAVLAAPHWPWPLCAAFALLCLACSPYLRVPERRRALLLPGLLLLCALSFGWARLNWPSGLAVTFLDAGQADAAAVSAEGRLYFADLGKGHSPAADYARYTGRRACAVFLTHPHSDHAGGLKELMSLGYAPDLYLSGLWGDVEPDPGIQALVDEAGRRGGAIRYLWAGDRVQLSPGVVCEVIAPERGFRPSSGNAASMMLRFVYGEGSVLIGGDLPASAEPANPPEASLIKASHHGAADATSTFLLRAAGPLVAVIPVGRNGYGHPSPALLERLRAAGVAAYRTDRSGAVTARIGADGTIEMETFL